MARGLGGRSTRRPRRRCRPAADDAIERRGAGHEGRKGVSCQRKYEFLRHRPSVIHRAQCQAALVFVDEPPDDELPDDELPEDEPLEDEPPDEDEPDEELPDDELPDEESDEDEEDDVDDSDFAGTELVPDDRLSFR